MRVTHGLKRHNTAGLIFNKFVDLTDYEKGVMSCPVKFLALVALLCEIPAFGLPESMLNVIM